MSPPLTWGSETTFEIDGQRFRVARSFEDMFAADDDPAELLLAKPPALVAVYTALAEAHSAGRIFELGVFRGGSAALLHALFRPRKLVAVDIRDDSSAALKHYQDNLAVPQSLACHYGVDQTDGAKLEEIVAVEFSGQPLDLVVDDASHLLEETTSSFNLLFPHLRPGGIFVIEDWPWAHRASGPGGQTVGDLFPRFQGQPALSSLVVEALLACGSGGDAVARVEVNHHCALIYRGSASLKSGEFDIREAYHLPAANPLTLRDPG